MPKTPVQADSTVRFNPYISKGISKSLLTPCRQVGLSRNRKTPNSAKNNSFSSLDSCNLDTTPVSSKSAPSDLSEKIESKVDPKISEKVRDRKKTRVSKCLIVDSDEEEVPLISLKVSKCVTEENVPLISLKDAKTDELDKNLVTKAASESPKRSKNTSKKKVKTKTLKKESKDVQDDLECQKMLDTNLTPHNSDKTKSKLKETPIKGDIDIQINGSEDLIIVDTNITQSKSNESKTNLKVIKIEENKSEFQHSSSVSGKNIEENEDSVLKDVTHCVNTKPVKNKTPVKCQAIQAAPIQTESKTKIKRSLSMKKSSSFEYDDIIFTECSVGLTRFNSSDASNSQCTASDVNYPQIDIKNLEKDVKEKQKRVDDLKQAEIYKKKHNVEELQQLTALWKTGCISALNDLLPQLQLHAKMDMGTLLNNLRVPKELISLSANGDLI